ncbi:MAG: MarR family transcriptional regulator [Thermoplasmatota archaeon]
MKDISTTDKIVFIGLVAFPDRRDREIAQRLSLPNSTFASAKARLMESGYLTEHYLPIFPKLGMELLATVYSDFNPSVSVDERVKNTRKTVEIYPEMIFSMGESHRGFSISIARNITRIMRISLERMRILAQLNLLEIELPIEVMFPFEISRVHRFFNLAPLIHKKFQDSDPKAVGDVGIETEELCRTDEMLRVGSGSGVTDPRDVDLNPKQLEILYHLVRNPALSSSRLSGLTDHSRHTISRVKDMLLEEGYIMPMKIPDMSRLDYSILSLFHAKIDPKKPITREEAGIRDLLQDDTIFYVSRPTELLMLASYQNYVQYNRGMSIFTQFLKSNNYQKNIPVIRNHSLGEAIWIKRFEYHPLIRDTFGLKVVK